jgi:hypothetical protein
MFVKSMNEMADVLDKEREERLKKFPPMNMKEFVAQAVAQAKAKASR